ncbi:glycosyltransferase family 2 protein [Myxococcota bacterium]|nr:glycosyltransferase family 2 protein [Myxococcota bacterium]
MKIAAVIPALDEEEAIGPVVAGLVALVDASTGARLVDEVVVGDNGSRDRTAEVARAAGATVVSAPIRGYGSACLKALDHLRRRAGGPPDVVVFVDGDGSNDTTELPTLVAPIRAGRADLVIGARVRRADPGSLTIPQRFGNELASAILRTVHHAPTTDLGPFRAITWPALESLGMEDPNYGWTVEMQVKAAKRGLRVTEVDVRNLVRAAGRSKVAGTVRGVAGASYKILKTLWKYR